MEYRKDGDKLIIRLDYGEEIMETLTTLLTDLGVGSASISGVGAVEDTTLGYFETSTMTYEKTLFPEDMELVSFSGNVTLLNGKPFVHAHATISGGDFRTLSGHVFSSTIAVTGEFHLTLFPTEVYREKDERTGLNLTRFA